MTVDWVALGDYTKDLGQARRSPNPFLKRASATADSDRIAAFRAGATHLDNRLAAGEHIRAALGAATGSRLASSTASPGECFWPGAWWPRGDGQGRR